MAHTVLPLRFFKTNIHGITLILKVKFNLLTAFVQVLRELFLAIKRLHLIKLKAISYQKAESTTFVICNHCVFSVSTTKALSGKFLIQKDTFSQTELEQKQITIQRSLYCKQQEQ